MCCFGLELVADPLRGLYWRRSLAQQGANAQRPNEVIETLAFQHRAVSVVANPGRCSRGFQQLSCPCDACKQHCLTHLVGAAGGGGLRLEQRTAVLDCKRAQRLGACHVHRG